MYEAVRRSPRLCRWPLVYPRTAGDLLTVLQPGRLAPPTVLWLNETR
jgi:hypothetical protein